MIKDKNIFRVIKYVFSAGSSFIVDLLFFTLFNYLFTKIILATIFARIISSLYNYTINSRLVFKNYSKTSIFKYYILVIIQMIVSAVSVSLLYNLFNNINSTIIKFFIDLIIFVINYFIQKEVVFK